MRPTGRTTFERARRGRAAAGFGLIDALLAAATLAVALAGHAASVVSGHRLSRSIEERGAAVLTLEKFIDRLRADPDWSGLYASLRDLSSESAADASGSDLGEDLALKTHDPAVYYADFVAPSDLGAVTVLVQVPSSAAAFGPAVLREDAVAPRYGLPSDLNGDGKVDGEPRDGDYQSLPVVARLRWQRSGEQAHEVVLATWLRGER